MSCLKCLLVFVVALFVAVPVFAEIIATGVKDTSGNGATFSAPASLIQGITASATGGGTPVAAGAGFGDIAQMNDGVVGTAFGANTQCMLLDNVTPTVWAVWTLDTSVNTAGYDIDSIHSFAGFNQDRAWQTLEIKYALVGDTITAGAELDRILVGNFAYRPTPQPTVYNATHMTIADSLGGPVLTGVKAIEVRFVDNGFHQGTSVNMSSYREISVVGSASTIPEPSSVALLVSAIMGLVAYAWRKRK